MYGCVMDSYECVCISGLEHRYFIAYINGIVDVSRPLKYFIRSDTEASVGKSFWDYGHS